MYLIKWVIREFKHDVYVRQQTAKVKSDFLFFPCNPHINHTKIKQCLLLFTANTNTLILLHRELHEDMRQKFAVNIMLSLTIACLMLYSLRMQIAIFD